MSDVKQPVRRQELDAYKVSFESPTPNADVVGKAGLIFLPAELSIPLAIIPAWNVRPVSYDCRATGWRVLDEP
jgi:hypothetical protein